MKNQIFSYCKTCGEKILNSWQGWPHKDVLPLLPRIVENVCENCGGQEIMKSTDISWLNYHSSFSTGLPDYWLLKKDRPRNKWGLPYLTEGKCPKCSGSTIISEMKYPNGTSEKKHNCQNCGIIIKI